MKKTYRLDFQKIRRKTQIKDIITFEMYLKNTFNDLAKRDYSENEGKGIDKISFVDYMNLPFIVGEKLFNIFDKKKNRFLNQSEFVNGIINLYVGSLEETQQIIFNLLDFDNDGKIIPEDSRLLISFIKNLANIPINNERFKIRTTLTDEEDFNEINELINNFFSNKSILTFEEYKYNIENLNSDVFFLFMYFLYNNKPFSDSSIKILKLINNSTNLVSSFSSSVMTSSSEDCNDNKSSVKTPSKVLKSLIFDLVDVDVDELEKDCVHSPEEKEILNNLELKIPEVNLEINIPNVKETYENFANKMSDRLGNLSINKSSVSNNINITKNYLEEKCIDEKDVLDLYDMNSKNINHEMNNNSNFKNKIKNNKKDFKLENSLTLHNSKTLNINNQEILSFENKIKTDENKINDNNIKFTDNIKINFSTTSSSTENYVKFKHNPNSLNFESSKNKIALNPLSLPKEENILTDITYENYIYKSRNNNKLKKYYIALIGMDLFYFSNSKKKKLKGMHNLSGSYIFEDDNIIKVREETKNKNELITVNYYPFKLHFKKKTRIYFCANYEETKLWIKHIRNITKYRDVTKSYIFGENLGKGKFGNVVLGINKENKQKVAIKIINKTNLKGIETEMVKTEIEIMKFCRHLNIVKLIDNFEDIEEIYIILEYLSGGNLNNFLSIQQTILSEEKIKQIILQVGSGINYLHHFGILHRDLKPENLMMSCKNNSAIVKIVDFGLSKILGVTEKSNDAYGTLSYAAPEVIQKYDYNKTIDIWSLGVILYFLICGYLPFNDKNNNVSKIVDDITKANIKIDVNIWSRLSVHAKDLVMKCLEKDLNERINISDFLNHEWFRK